MTEKLCKTCKHYQPADQEWQGLWQGSCALMKDANTGMDPKIHDRVYGWDCEGYVAGTYVGPEFGCIHWSAKA